MQRLCKNDSLGNSLSSTSPCDASYPQWWTSSEPNTPQSYMPKFSHLKVGTQTIDYHNTKELGSQVRDRDSPSTQSTGRSYSEVVHWGGNNTHGQSIFSAQSSSCALLSTHSSFSLSLSLPLSSFGRRGGKEYVAMFSGLGAMLQCFLGVKAKCKVLFSSFFGLYSLLLIYHFCNSVLQVIEHI